MKTTIFILFLLVLSYQQLYTQQVFPPLPEAKRPHIAAPTTAEKIVIDGNTNEPAWQKASVVTHFTVSYPRQGAKATYETEVRILYDQTNLYISAHCYFPPGKKGIQVQNMRRDFGFTDNELFEVLIDPFKDQRLPVMAFCVTPYGTQMDIMHYADGSYDYNWDALWQGASKIRENAWTTEIAIPFATLRYPRDATEWSINFVRNIRQFGELNGWSPWPMAFNESRMEYAGILTGIHPPKSNLNLRFEPYALVSSISNNQSKTANKFQAGGEIKYAVNTSTLLEATINTDFAQAEADKEVINLSRSSVFFPEKRQFFLENSSLFSVGQNGIIQPFFSRRIGLGDNGEPLKIDGGIRLIHQDRKQSLGLLAMKQDGDTLENGAWFGVMRYKRNINDRLQLGAMTVLRENLPGHNQSSSFNPVGVGDVFWRVSQPLFIRGMTSFSANSLTGQKGSSAFGEVNYTSNKFAFDLLETAVSKNYNAQSGFVARNDFINTQPNIFLNFYRNWFPKKIAFFSPQLTADIYHKASSGRFQEANVNLMPFNLLFTNLAQINFNITSSWENLTSNFSPVRTINIATGDYHFNRYELYVLTNQGAHYSAEMRLSTGGYYDGNLNSYYLSVRAAPVPHLSLIMSYTRNDFKHAGIGGANATTHLLAPELRLATSPKILLSAFYQYNTDAQNGSLNARFSWQYRPLSFIYLVINTLNNYDRKPFEQPLRQISGILKVTYIYQL